jgi:nickel/cobalt exporter
MPGCSSPAILLGALHGLEPGHSKTMMAAFIVAIRGTVKQAVLLGLAATISHTSVVWLIAFGGMYISQKFTAESAEPWFQLISAVIILGTAAWMFWRTWRGEKLWKMEQEEEHSHGHHDHDETRIIDTGHGSVELDFRRRTTPSLAFTLAQRQEMGSSRHFSGDQPWSRDIFTGI